MGRWHSLLLLLLLLFLTELEKEAGSGGQLRETGKSYSLSRLRGARELVAVLQCLHGKESACSAGDVGSIPGSGRSPGEGNGNPL